MKKGMKVKVKNKVNGLSPVIATVLLIVIVIVIALIVFIWIRGMVGDAVTKFDNKNVQLVCGDVAFEASYTGGTLYIMNSGSVPIFGMNVKDIEIGKHSTFDLRNDSATWPKTGLNQGDVFSEVFSFEGSEIVLIPVLLGESKKGRKTHVCDEKQYGYKIII